MRRLSDSARHGEESDYWIPITNIFAALLLVASLVLFIEIAQQQKITASLPVETGQMPDTPAVTSQVLDAASKTESALMAREQALLLREKELTIREEAVSEAAVEVAEAAAMKNEIIDTLTRELSGLNLPVEINQVTGNIRFTEAVLFDINRDTLNDEGQKYLESFVPKYLSVLLSDRYKKYLDQIVIEGHADNDGSYQFNLDLSQKRANSVMAFILLKQLTRMSDGVLAEKYFAISARSFNVPVLVNGAPNSNQCRRVEFVFSLKDEEIFRKIQNLSDDYQP